jgi:hypothetical protein
MSPEEVRNPVDPDSMKARIAGYHLKSRFSSRVFGKDGPDVFSDAHHRATSQIK